MRINIYGMGYVGCVSAACLAREGHRVVGVDVNKAKVDMINSGRSPIVEPGLDELIHHTVAGGCLRASTEAMGAADIVMVCVGTPSGDGGRFSLKQMDSALREIGRSLRSYRGYTVVVIRSTVMPGTIEDHIIPLVERYSGRRAGADFGVCMNPEFMREGTSLRDFKEPPFTVIGGIDARSKNHVAKLYKHLSAPLISMDVKSAEMVKYVCNSFHGLKVVFANEIGNVCKMLGIDSHQVMDVFCRDTKLNVSAAYFKPGFAFGGSCLPKDLRALLHKAKNLDLELPMLRSVMLSNSLQIDRAYEMIRRTGRKRVGILGLTFKANTDDLRESPAVALVEVLLGKGYEVCVYDRDFSMSMLFGANRAFIEKAIPHIASLLRSSVEDVIRASDVVVACTQNPQFAGAINRHAKKKWIVDLVRLHGVDTKIRRYNGICW